MNLRFSRRARFLAYGLAGWAVDSLFVFAHTGRRRPSSLLNVPVYGLAELLFEPAHDRLRHRPLALRAALYGAGILGVEYASGRLLRRLVGHVPWNYGRSRLSIDGFVRIDYLPLWAAFGLGLELLHDLLVGRRSVQWGPGRVVETPEAHALGIVSTFGESPTVRPMPWPLADHEPSSFKIA